MTPNTWLIVGVSVVVITVLSIGAYFLLNGSKSDSSSGSKTSVTKRPPVESADVSYYSIAIDSENVYHFPVLDVKVRLNFGSKIIEVKCPNSEDFKTLPDPKSIHIELNEMDENKVPSTIKEIVEKECGSVGVIQSKLSTEPVKFTVEESASYSVQSYYEHRHTREPTSGRLTCPLKDSVTFNFFLLPNHETVVISGISINLLKKPRSVPRIIATTVRSCTDKINTLLKILDKNTIDKMLSNT
jgi:uncharacterized protein (UPF0333 family)